jgi:hypothetical protein
MAAGPFVLVNTAIEDMIDQTIDLNSDTFVAVLITATHTPSPTDDTWSDISANEATGSGYTSGGQVVSPLTISRTAGVVTVDSVTNPTWNPATVSAKYVYLVRRAGGSLAAGDLILGYMDLNVGGGNLSAVGSEFTVEWPTEGLFTIARAP